MEELFSGNIGGIPPHREYRGKQDRAGKKLGKDMGLAESTAQPDPAGSSGE